MTFRAGRREPASGATRTSRRGWLARRTLRTRLGLASIALMAAVSLVIGLVSVAALKVFLEQRLDDSLTSAVRRSRLAAEHPDAVRAPPPAPDANRAALVPGFLFAPGQAQGTLGGSIESSGDIRAAVLNSVGDATGLTSAQRETLRSIPADERPHTVDFGTGLGTYRLLAQRTPHGETLITGLPLSGVRDAVLQLILVISLVTVVGLLLAAIVGAAIVRRTLRPLSRVAATATQVTELPLDRGEVALAVRVPDADTDLNTEVGQVGAALNRMLVHVADALAARQASEARTRRFVADASHELRTPLTSIRGYAELTRRSGQLVPPDVAHALSRVESEAIRMTGLVEELLMLARLDESRPARREPLDLSRLLVEAVGDAHAAGQHHHWALDLPVEAVTVIGDKLQLQTVVANLLANARVHTPAGTTVDVRLEARGPDAVLLVSDDGPGIASDLLPEVFERFTRGDESRGRTTGGTGLGLSIVAGVVAAHEGHVDVTSEPGLTVFTVHLPRAKPTATPSPPTDMTTGQPPLTPARVI
jgi:two-component system OmpR family sensor kinase